MRPKMLLCPCASLNGRQHGSTLHRTTMVTKSTQVRIKESYVVRSLLD